MTQLRWVPLAHRASGGIESGNDPAPVPTKWVMGGILNGTASGAPPPFEDAAPLGLRGFCVQPHR